MSKLKRRYGDHVARRLTESGGVVLPYRAVRDATHELEPVGTVGRADIRIAGETYTLEGDCRAFYFYASDLEVIGEPQAGDEITHLQKIYVVTPLDGSGSKCWDWITANETRLQIHAKLYERVEDVD